MWFHDVQWFACHIQSLGSHSSVSLPQKRSVANACCSPLLWVSSAGGGHGYRHANRALGNPRFIGLPILSAKVGMAFVSVAKCPAF